MSLDTQLHSKPAQVPDIDWDSSGLWAIGIMSGDKGQQDYPVSWRDHARDIAWFGNQLARMGAGKGSLLLQCGNTIDWIHNGAIQRACAQLGVTWAPVMAMAHDAYRLEMYLRRFDFDIVMGVNEGLLDGLEQMNMSLDAVFSSVHTIVATPGAQRRLVEAGVEAWTAFELGPVVAYRRFNEEFSEFDHKSWRIDVVEGQLCVTSEDDRACRLQAYRTGYSGKLDADGEKPLLVLAED